MTGPIAKLAKEVDIEMKASPGGHGYETFNRTSATSTKGMSKLNVFSDLRGTMQQLAGLGFMEDMLGFEGMEHLASITNTGSYSKSVVIS